ncbi:hypothetical protein CORC01_03453 [Colletotrichum orchidophilum]|uniref:Uncharacterized protein n=1 Tax=Colletotrichum orchidophilum TaxID=1209926 RepID=A0A1G4BI81_9PEZI|nr:uncharacterized protein CORC01_03453 [Colletotrichum orchidophilum]OHF01139.1 hypothetical protein CORC01_03453 [Colletotrichum orchidophilum]
MSRPAPILPTFRFGFGNNDSFQLSVQAPSWLTGSVYSVLVQKSYQGWQLNLRAYEVVKRFGVRLLICLHIDDPSGTFRVLSKHNMTPFVRDSRGHSLFQLAVRMKSLMVVNSFLERGLESLAREPMSSKNDDPFLLYELERWTQSGQRYILEPTFQKLFMDNFLDDYLEDPAHISDVFDCGIGFHFYQMILQRYTVMNKPFALATRLRHLRLVVKSCYWEADEVCVNIIPEAKNLDACTAALAHSRNLQGSSLFHSFAMGMAGNFARRRGHPNPDQWAEARRSWSKLLHDSIRLDRPSLHHIDWTSNWIVNGGMSSPLCSIIKSLIGSSSLILSTAEQVCESLKAAFSEWIAILSSSDVELLDYGREERHKYEQGLTDVSQRWGPWHSDSRGTARFSLFGITYGSCPEHWRLWWTYEYEDYAGEFWNMIQDEAIKVPGAWVDDSWDEGDFPLEEWGRLEAWEKEQPSPLIWSEYRRIQPPI